ncbi:hypothetical protein NicSoilC12_37330 [Arthrobacter sp. NicSoilC12]|nr:hypothetical protein NicSoilC12_37330 [Arthrobacter sp. NicSoilC12]VXB96381.1 hypothetical protein ARTHRO8AJ_40156 [Arthrobacter sp. 8AJ]
MGVHHHPIRFKVCFGANRLCIRSKNNHNLLTSAGTQRVSGCLNQSAAAVRQECLRTTPKTCSGAGCQQ